MSSEQQFRESLRSFRWANTAGQGTPNTTKPSSPFARLTETTTSFFGSVGNRVQGYVPLRGNAPPEEESWFALTRWQRLTGFAVCLAAAIFCFLIAFLTLPIIAIKPRKFAVTYTMGSLLVVISFALLHGPVSHFKHIFSTQRLPFTISYFSSMIGTLFFAIYMHSYIFTIVFTVIQVIALTWYVVSYFPGGTGTLRYGTSMLSRQATGILPL